MPFDSYRLHTEQFAPLPSIFASVPVNLQMIASNWIICMCVFVCRQFGMLELLDKFIKHSQVNATLSTRI